MKNIIIKWILELKLYFQLKQRKSLIYSRTEHMKSYHVSDGRYRKYDEMIFGLKFYNSRIDDLSYLISTTHDNIRKCLI